MENKKVKKVKEEPIVTMEGFMEEFEKFRKDLAIIHDRESNYEIQLKALNKLLRTSNKLIRDIKKIKKSK
jgi:hypothetical protein